MSKKEFKRVLIANRGEISCRLSMACKALGLESIAVYSEADKGALHTRVANQAYLIGPGPATDSYLNIDNILKAAKESKAQAVHPGYGFLSERAHFAKEVKDAGLVWVGPPADVISKMGNKINAKKLAEKAKVPTLKWSLLEAGWKEKDLKEASKNVGFPLLLKAASGGGGRGMRVVERESELLEKAKSAMSEAQSSFGSSEIFLEKYCEKARHIEVQILADTHGTVITLGERECSVQRRHQKVIEEAPAINLSNKTRAALWDAAIRLAKNVGYINAGTCEFLVDLDESFYFLEMNTRLQVEHPVTELVWGVDLPVLQFEIAQGKKLEELLDIKNLASKGHAIEVRIYAEDPSKHFMPSPGKLTRFTQPTLPGIRFDTGYVEGDTVPIFYDAMMAKLISWGMNREQARLKTIEGLKSLEIYGVKWNGPYLEAILKHKKFIEGKIITKFLELEFTNWSVASNFYEKKITQQDPRLKKCDETSQKVNPWLVYSSKIGSGQGLLSSFVAHDNFNTFEAEEFDATLDANNPLHENELRAEYPGKVLRVLVKVGDSVVKGQLVAVCESMKMEFSYSAHAAKKVKTVCAKEGQLVQAGALLVEWI